MTEVGSAPGWRMSVPQHWVVWVPGAPDMPALRAAAATNRRAGLALTQGVGVIERELATAPGDLLQAGVRVPEPGRGHVTASLRLTSWPRPRVGEEPLTAEGHLAALQGAGTDPARQYRHHEVSVARVPAGQLVLTNEIWRKKWGVRDLVRLVTTIFPRASEQTFQLEVTSRYGELQPALMADTSLMAHSFEITGTAGPES